MAAVANNPTIIFIVKLASTVGVGGDVAASAVVAVIPVSERKIFLKIKIQNPCLGILLWSTLLCFCLLASM